MQATVSIANNLFVPATVTIAAGGTVTWTNNDTVIHTATATDSSWDSGFMAKAGGTYQRTFPTAGTYPYLCTLHPEMVGTVVVVDAAGNAPPATPVTTQQPPPQQNTTTPPVNTPPAGNSATLPTLAEVTMAGNLFAPRTVTVAVGGTVRWLNNDTRPHTVTAADGSFDSGIMAKNATFERVYPTAGTYPYVCAIHPDMTGTVVAATTPAAAATAVATVTTQTKAKAKAKKVATKKARTTKKSSPVATATRRAGAPAPATASVSMKGSVFTPTTVTIRPGGTVTWVNDDAVMHTVTAGDGSFDSGIMAKGATFVRTFPKAGTYQYTCSLHPGMDGTVVVAATASAARAAAPAAPTKATTPKVAPAPSATPSTSPAPPAAPAPKSGSGPIKASVEMRDNVFAPANLTIPVGSTVTFTNTGKLPHTATAQDKSFDSGIIPPGGTWSTTFTKVGTFKYDCILHPGMTGTITVTEADDPAAAAAPVDNATGGPPSTSAAEQAATMSSHTPETASGTSGTATASSASVRGVAILVSTAVFLAGLAYMLGLLIVQEPRWRQAAERTVAFGARVWSVILAHVVHPIHPRPVQWRPRLH